MTLTRRTLPLIGALVLLAFLPVNSPAQNRSRFAGMYNAVDYAYGVVPAAQALTLSVGNAATGSQTVTVSFGQTTIADGTVFSPLSTNAPISVGSGSNAETVTPSAVSCSTPAIYSTCSFTASFSNLHGIGDMVASGSIGVQEAINDASNRGGGTVLISGGWVLAGGTNTILAAAAPASSVAIQDNRGLTGATTSYWTMQPTTLTSLAVPATLTSTTMTWTVAPVGTWAASATYACVAYVDALGGEGPCSATYNSTPTLHYTLNITSPAASTGAVGYRVYAGTGSLATAYLLPITSANCVVTTAESVIPACAIGANAIFPTAFATTSLLKPNTQTSPTVNVNQTLPQGHTTFSYQPSATVPVPFQTNFGPFPAFGSTTSAQVDTLGTAQLPAGYLNLIGRTIRVSGKIAATVNTAAVPTVTVALGWPAGQTAGAPTAVCTDLGAAYGSSAAFNLTFSCTMTVNAPGATAVGTIMTNSTLAYAPAAGGAGAVTVDTGTAAIASLGLFGQDTIFIQYTSGTNTTSAVQLLDLHIETLQ